MDGISVRRCRLGLYGCFNEESQDISCRNRQSVPDLGSESGILTSVRYSDGTV